MTNLVNLFKDISCVEVKNSAVFTRRGLMCLGGGCGIVLNQVSEKVE